MRVRLAGGLKGTASSAEIREDGSLVVELYDFSEDAQNHFGNDVAFLLIVPASEKPRLLSLLVKGHNMKRRRGNQDHLLLHHIKDHFVDYYAFKKWLEEYGITYEKEFDSWA